MYDKRKILIVDDVKSNIDLLKGVLESKFKLQAALNGIDALKIAQMTEPDMILLDVNMPGLDGYDVTDKLRNSIQTKEIPIIMITANNDTKDELECLKHGATDFISKPINRELLLLKIAKYIYED